MSAADEARWTGRQLGEVLDLVDETVAAVTDDEVERRLNDVATHYQAFADMFGSLHPPPGAGKVTPP